MAGDEQPRELARSPPAAASSSSSGAICGSNGKDTTAAVAAAEEEHRPQQEQEETMTGHPYGIKPWGNYLSSGRVEELKVRAQGLGPLLSSLGDEVLVHALLFLLDGPDLARLSRASRALYAFCHYPDLWKALTLTELAARHAALPEEQRSPEGPRLRYRRSWKETFVGLMASSPASPTSASAAAPDPSAHRHKTLRVRGLYSDVLHAPYGAAQFRGRLKAAWLAKDTCPRLHRPSLEEFRRACEEPNRPCVLTGVMADWPALRKWATPEGFLAAATATTKAAQARGVQEFTLHGGGLSFSVPEYAAYAAAQHDDLPLYIFDSRFADKSPALAADYAPHLPPYFQDDTDLFSLLRPDGATAEMATGQEEVEEEGDGGRKAHEEKKQQQQQRLQGRPDNRWIIWGPRGSGSTFHKDPNATSAWNAVIRGAKKWILFPPHVTPPGVHPSADGLDLATPVTLAEWFEGFYPAAASEAPYKRCIVEAVVRAGEVMFVPRGWWHLVLNLEESLAITQNFASEVGLSHVLAFLDERRHLISGLPDAERPLLYERFVEVLSRRAPAVLARAQAQRQRRRQQPQQEEEEGGDKDDEANARSTKRGRTEEGSGCGGGGAGARGLLAPSWPEVAGGGQNDGGAGAGDEGGGVGASGFQFGFSFS